MPSDHTSRTGLFRDALYDAFAGRGPVTVDPLVVLRDAIERGREAAGPDDSATEVLDALASITGRGGMEEALSEAAARFESPQRFREALFFVRCLDRDGRSALDVMHAREYLAGATVPANSFPDLAARQAELLESTTFESQWAAPERAPAMLDAIEAWRQAYAGEYKVQHEAFDAALIPILERVRDGAWLAEAIDKLNGVTRLGAPVAVQALTRFRELDGLTSCPSRPEELGRDLEDQPVCPHCGYRLGDVPPATELEAVLGELEDGLEKQRGRLGEHAVARVRSLRGGASGGRLDRLVQAVEAHDLRQMAQALDEGMLEFLRDVLDSPDARASLMEQLARQFPQVTSDTVEEAVAAFRRLLEAELDRGGGRIVLTREDGA